MLKPSVRTLYQCALDSGIVFRLGETPVSTLEIEYAGLISDKPLSRVELDKLESDYRERIEPHRLALTEFLKQQRLIEEFNELLTSKSIDKESISVLKDIREKLDDILA